MGHSAASGQRVVPPYPSLREMAADAWREFSGWQKSAGLL
jgi:hypothetical protein